MAETQGKTEEAYDLYLKAEGHGDATEKAAEMAYRTGVRLSFAGKYEAAVEWLQKAGAWE